VKHLLRRIFKRIKPEPVLEVRAIKETIEEAGFIRYSLEYLVLMDAHSVNLRLKCPLSKDGHDSHWIIRTKEDLDQAIELSLKQSDPWTWPPVYEKKRKRKPAFKRICR